MLALSLEFTIFRPQGARHSRTEIELSHRYSTLAGLRRATAVEYTNLGIQLCTLGC